MKIKKIGHCCLVIEENGKRIMTDPGSWTVESHANEENIDLIIITHEHPDHIHAESLKEILKKSPLAKIITNEGVGKLLDEAGIEYEILENKIPKDFGVELEAHDCKHEEIFEEMGQVKNTGYFIGKRLFYPGDSFYDPLKPVEILALPVAGPWTNIKSSILYGLKLKPKIAFPVHDANCLSFGTSHRVPAVILPKYGILFKDFENLKQEEF